MWEGRFIAETTLTRTVADLRRALGDSQRAPQYIETIPKRGYRLVADVAAPACARIADRLASARRRRFVGRQAEIALFRSALLSGDPAFVALHVTGAGGVGKTTLLQEYAVVADEAGRKVLRIDGRNIEASPVGFLLALSHALGVDGCELTAMLEQWPAGGVLLVDTYELLSPLDEWLRDTLLPQLPARSLVVIAGRHEPGTAWRTNVDWAGLTRIQPLGNLDPDESRDYLTRCGLPAEQHGEALAFTRGHPLALSLTADVLTRGARLASSPLETEPEIVRLLIEKFVQDVPSREHRLALHACVTARALTEPLLAAALDRDDVHDLFDWLGRLAFVESGPYGLFPHDLARDVVYMDFRWRDPDAAYRVTERLIGYLYGRLEGTQGLERLRVWFELIYLQRYNPNLRPFFEWVGFGTTFAQTASAADHSAILEMVERHEGRLIRGDCRSLAAAPARRVLHGTQRDRRADRIHLPPAARGGHPRRHGRRSSRGESRRSYGAIRAARRWRTHGVHAVPDPSRALSGPGAGAGRGELFTELDGARARLVLHRGR